MSNYNYNPIPPRVWSRVQNQCTYVVPGSTYQEAYIPLTGQTVPQGQADYEMKMFYKGNILQYKGNSARFTKAQKYSQLARMCGPNRTKVFATQSETYSNPNTTGLLRVGYSTYNYPNQIVGAPNNISGPFSYNLQNPNDCSSNSVQDGGILVCGTYANPCSGEVYQRGPTTATICYPSYTSDVPGTSILCWNNNLQTFFPRSRYFMNNSANKWPQGYKGFLSALKPNPPVLLNGYLIGSVIQINWDYTNPCNFFNISFYNVYYSTNGTNYTPIINIGNNTTYNLQVNLSINQTYYFYVTSVSGTYESNPSNIITVQV